MAVDQLGFPLPARTAVGELALRSVLAASTAAARLAGVAEPEATDLDPVRVAIAYSSERWLRVGGERPTAFAPLSGFFATDDRWVRTHGNYPHHARAMRAALGLAADAGREAAASAFLRQPAKVVAERITAAGGLCVPVDVEDPDADAALRAAPLVRSEPIRSEPIRSERIGADRVSAASVPLRGADPHAPLAGIRVLDLTRVIAGPVATRTLALLGADVLRIDAPQLPELPWQHLDTGHGKRSALLDLRDSAARRTFDGLLASADVVVLGYRAAALDRLGLAPAQLAERRPGIIVARLSAWGSPDRRGFDSLVQAASGIAWIESPDGSTPGALPAQALDHSAGYLLAAEIMTLLSRRADEGGSWIAETSLRRVAAELLGLPRSPEPPAQPPLQAPAESVQEFDVDGIQVTTAAPALSYPGAPTRFRAPRPWGGDIAEWSSAP